MLQVIRSKIVNTRMLYKAFTYLDTHKKNKLTNDDIKKILNRKGIYPSEEMIQAIFNEVGIK